jgi:hypothetical protein
VLVTLAVVTPVVMTPKVVTSRKLMMLVMIVEGDATNVLTTDHPPTRSNATDAGELVAVDLAVRTIVFVVELDPAGLDFDITTSGF